jgi:Geminivirus rep protein central domain
VSKFTSIDFNYPQCIHFRQFESSKEGLRAALDAPTKEDFFACVRATDPKVYITMYEKLEYYSRVHYTPPRPAFTPKFQDFVRVPQVMQDWVRTEFIKVSLITVFYLIIILTYLCFTDRPSQDPSGLGSF